ncbi:MAG: hypothetical protein EPO07_16010 [Verrucomicrobia bacterium]|nr:MAG: hypothetical protein EPO07_16010 [Verrucomicrobiota bacterium]
MSLKAFHVIFITAASAMCVGFGLWMLRDYRTPEGSAGDLAWAIGGFVVGAGLLVYERFFLKKLKSVSYL